MRACERILSSSRPDYTYSLVFTKAETQRNQPITLMCQGNGFEHHIAHDHNMWKYLFFLVYLKERDFEDYSGGESFVFQRTLTLEKDPNTHESIHDCDTGKELKLAKQKMDLLWFPQRDAMVLKNMRSSADEELIQKLQRFHDQNAKLTQILSSQVNAVACPATATPPSSLSRNLLSDITPCSLSRCNCPSVFRSS